MKKVFWLLTALLSCPFALYTQCADPSNIYTFVHAGHTYEVVREMKNWSDAAACAVERGGYLTEINDMAEQNALFDAILNGAGVSPTYTIVPNGGGIAYVWIGATDKHTEGQWLWDGDNDQQGTLFWIGQGSNGSGNGTPVGGAYVNWGGSSTGTPKEPDNYGSGQHYAAMGLTGWPSGSTSLGIAGEWNDITGTNLLYFVIEKETGVGSTELKPESNLIVVPGPERGIVCLLIPGGKAEVEIRSLSGVSIFREKDFHSRVVNLSKHAAGVYVSRVFDGKNFLTRKFVML